MTKSAWILAVACLTSLAYGDPAVWIDLDLSTDRIDAAVEAAAGDTVWASVLVTDVKKLDSYGFDLVCDTAAARVTLFADNEQAGLRTILKQNGGSVLVQSGRNADGANIGVTMVGKDCPRAANGDGLLAIARIVMKHAGPVSIGLRNVKLLDCERARINPALHGNATIN